MKYKINPEDKVVLTLSYRQVAKLYAIMGRVNGTGDSSCWGKLKEIVEDFDQSKYNSFVYEREHADAMEYSEYQDEWEKILFSEQKSEAEIQLEKLQEQIKELEKQAQKLKESIS